MDLPKRTGRRSAPPHGKSRISAAVEHLESRRLLSAQPVSPATVFVCAPPSSAPSATPAFITAAAKSGAAVDGYTPSQIRRAYGVDQVQGDGTGQTIAIVDAYNDPSIASDLAAFDTRFGIAPPPSLAVVDQTGNPVKGLRTDGAWASEMAMDVEWAHAIAPNANLLLVETRTDTIPDLMAGVDYARNAAGVSVVALSWSGPEFRGQLKYDATFTTPVGHQGVTFIAAAGDNGAAHGATWPSSSPNVLSVGGTTLYTSDAAGDYSLEVGWKNSSGGFSHYERRPGYQTGVVTGSARSTPDVAYSADPNLGFAVYSSVNDGGYVGWSSIAGTSAGVPQWAGQVAIADQMRAAAGSDSLDSATGTLPALYKLYSPPKNISFATYNTNFNDITLGRGSSRVRAGAGYDQLTGLGSPKAGQIIRALAGATASTPTTTTVAPVASGKHAKPSAARGGDEYGESTGSTPSPRMYETSHIRPARATGVTPARQRGVGSPSASSSEFAALPVLLSTGDTRPTLPDVAFSNVVRPLIVLSTLPTALRHSTAVSMTALNEFAPPIVQFADEIIAGPIDPSSPVAAVLKQAIAKSAFVPMLDFDRPESLGSFADALSDFAYESTALGGAMAVAAGSHARAWGVTAAVLMVDVVLIAAWRAAGKPTSKSKRRGENRYELEPQFYAA